MEWIERMNKAIDYIEENLTEKPDYEKLGSIACCSSYHFQRMFTYMAGITLSEYLRRRKMSLAAADLQSTDEKIIEIAAKYGYQSPTAFNRAFQSVHGLAPSAVRQEGVTVKSYPPIAFQITVKGVQAMEYRIETKEAFQIAGISAPLSGQIEDNFKTVPEMWMKAAGDGTIQKLASIMDSEPAGLLGVSVCSDREQWKYFIAVSTSKEDSGFETYTVPAAAWAVFPGEGTNLSMQDLERRIVTEWLPASGYEYGNAPDIEVYLNADPQNAKYEVWIPVVKKDAAGVLRAEGK